MQSRTTATKSTNGLQTESYTAYGEHTARLYRLAYLITADAELSAQAVGAALNFEQTDLKVRTFALVAAACNRIAPQLKQSILLFQEALRNGLEIGAKALSKMRSAPEPLTTSHVERALLAMDVFQRSVVLLTVLERFSDSEASKALSIDPQLIKVARAQGLVSLTQNVSDAINRDADRAHTPRSKKMCRASVN